MGSRSRRKEEDVIVEAALLAYHSSSIQQSIEKAAAANTPTTLHPQPAPYQHENVLSTSEADPVLTLDGIAMCK